MRKLKVFLEMIKFEHTLFALPFAFMGALLGSMVQFGHLPSWAQIGWILLAMVGARTAAMGLNRVIDKAIDKKNPRTSKRAIPAGLISSREAVLFIVISVVLLIIAASQLNRLCLELSPLAVFFFVFYSFTKRFTWACHIVLGITLGLAPLGGWLAVTGRFDLPVLIFFVSVAMWSAGFDVIYACQDVEFDRKEGLFSIPARFGIRNALILSRIFHLLTAFGLTSLFFLTSLSWIYVIGLVVAYIILFYEHFLVRANDLSKLNTAFFTMNGLLSTMMFLFTMVDLVLHRL